MSGQKLPLKMSVDYISFSAHTDYQQTSEFIRALKPPHVVSVGVWCSASRGGGAQTCFPAAASQLRHCLLFTFHLPPG